MKVKVAIARKMRTTLYGIFNTNIRGNMTMKKISPPVNKKQRYETEKHLYNPLAGGAALLYDVAYQYR